MYLVRHLFWKKHMLPAENRCPYCLQTELSSFPRLPNESFTFNYNVKRGIELKFHTRKKLFSNYLRLGHIPDPYFMSIMN